MRLTWSQEWLHLLALTSAILQCVVATVEGAMRPDETQLVTAYLKKYGYLDASAGDKDDVQKIEAALSRFSNEMLGFFNDDASTTKQLLELMQQPRCTNHEQTSVKLRRRAKRFVLNDYKWQFTDITWKFHDPKRLFKKQKHFEMARQTMSDAFNLWSAATGQVLQFRQLPPSSTEIADIDIYFAKYDHNDFEAFDGKGGVVAHSGYPMDGQIHFDASEIWSIKGKRGVDLTYVSTHELGHALGLRHSDQPNAVMHPIYKRGDRLALTTDDITGIRKLYATYVTKEEAIRDAKERYARRLKLFDWQS